MDGFITWGQALSLALDHFFCVGLPRVANILVFLFQKKLGLVSED